MAALSGLLWWAPFLRLAPPFSLFLLRLVYEYTINWLKSRQATFEHR